MIFRAREFKYIFPRPALVMGIVNVTPDSFSDGGKFYNSNTAVAHALKLANQGADILDIGGESTRPGARPVSEKEECRRVIPVIEKLQAKLKARQAQAPAISIDTMKPAVAQAALEAGASIVNDVTAGRNDDEMWRTVSEFHAGYVVMHAPPGLHQKRKTKNVVHEVSGFFSEQLKKLKAAGIRPEQIIFDPGIGFGKNLEQNLQLLAHLERFALLRRPLLLGVSRKSFIGKLFGTTVNERLPASLACAILGIAAGANIIRTHDVAETVRAIRMAETVLKRQK